MAGPDGSLARVLLTNALENDPEGLFFADLQGRIICASRAFAYAVGVDDPQTLVGTTARDWLSPDSADRFLADQESVLRTGVPVIELHERLEVPGEPDSWVTATRHPLVDGGRLIGTFGVMHDITARKRMERLLQSQAADMAQANAELRRAEADLRSMLDATPDPISRWDRGLRLIYVNPAGVDLLGLPAPELLDRSPLEVPSLDQPSQIEHYETVMRRVLATGEPAEIESEVQIRGVNLFLHTRIVPEHDVTGAVSGLLLVSRDLTARKHVEDLLAERALRDPLTGLANRVLLTDRLDRALRRMDRHPDRIAVLFVDLDAFKAVNDTVGHAGGDALLVEVARRLSHAARRSDTVARFGGDEFVVLCEDVADSESVAQVAERIIAEVGRPFVYRGEKIRPGASVGIALAQDDRQDAESLIREADAAMYRAKSRRTGGYQIFDRSVRDQLLHRLGMENDLRRGLERGEFSLAYQPMVGLLDRELIGVEALLRWRRPDGSSLPPATFVPIAEQTGLIVPLGRWVMDEALRRLAEWNAGLPAGRRPLTMAINVSPRQLGHTTLVDDLAAALTRHRVPPELLTLEITETAMLEESLISGEVFAQLTALGVRLALDDFGTGYSSLGHLRRLPVNVLKIDRMFVEGLEPGTGEAAIVAAVTAMARALGITTVGEGIETTHQLETLVGLGCDEGQGFLLARPMAPDALVRRYFGPGAA